MLKKYVFAVLLIGSSTLLCANTMPKKESKLIVNDLVSLPFPGGKMFKSGKIQLTDDQKIQFASEVKPIMHEKYNPLIQEIFLLEKSIQREVVKKAKIFDETLKNKITQVAQLKQEAMSYKMEALLKIKSILTAEQWHVWVNN